ncbi:RDD family protein [Luteolibacter sp. LG18]|uniref:RDD family protein n=1 Tax=Luteolibacter sp. LG18 TaxID=2819286 RepID=UPI002B2D2A07|nr:hypothetical protein llg_34060 [Luteolibacter sp. LG18]
MSDDASNPYAAPASVESPAVPVTDAGLEYVSASAGLRFANLIVDQITAIALIFVAGFVYAIVSDGVEENAIFFRLVGYGVFFGYYVLMESVFGRTVGKFVTGTKVVDWNDEKPSFGRICIRSLCRFIPFEAFSFLGQSASGWHDSISKTHVVKVTPVQRVQPVIAPVVPGKPPVYRQPLPPVKTPSPPSPPSWE